MTKLDIYNLALLQHGKKCTREEMEMDQYKPVEVEICDRMYPIAVENVLGEFDWAFCVVPIEVDRANDEPFGKWSHGYSLPENVVRIARVDANQKPFMVAGGRLYTNDPDMSVWGVVNDSKIMALAPDDFCYLVAMWMAYLISTAISPSDANLPNRILQMYSAQLQSLMKREINHMQESYLSDDDWSLFK